MPDTSCPPVRRAGVAAAVAALTVALAAPALAAPAPADAPPTGAAPGAPWTQDVAAPASANWQNDLAAVTAPAPGQAFAAGHTLTALPGAWEWRTLVQQWDGTSWTRMNTPDVETAPSLSLLRGIDGVSATDVWAVGSAGTTVGSSLRQPYAIHYDGVAWRAVPVPQPTGVLATALTDVAAVAPDDAWAVGTTGGLPGQPFVSHWDGTAWTSRVVRRPAWCASGYAAELTSVAVVGSRDVLVGGYCQTADGQTGYVLERPSAGAGWTLVARSMPGTTGVQDLTVTASGDVWAVGSQSVPASQASRGFALVRRAGVWSRVLRPVVVGRGEDVHGVADGPAGVTVVSTNFTTAAGAKPGVVTRVPGGWLTHAASPAPVGNAYLNDVASDGTTSWAVGFTIRPDGVSVPYILHS